MTEQKLPRMDESIAIKRAEMLVKADELKPKLKEIDEGEII